MYETGLYGISEACEIKGQLLAPTTPTLDDDDADTSKRQKGEVSFFLPD